MNIGRFSPLASFRELLTLAVQEFAEAGYTSPERLAEWIARLRNAAERELGPDRDIDAEIRHGLESVFDRFVYGTKIDQIVPGVSRYTKAMVAPKLHAELDRRIAASADLIKLNKKEAVDRTIKRFSGWATSIPAGGDETVDRREAKSLLGKELVDYRYHKRFVDTDQGHKLIANVADLVAQEAGAIAARWNSHGTTDPSYNARRDHLGRAGKIYLIRDSWAHREGLVKPLNGYLSDITMPGQEPNCRCWATYITSPRKLPDEMLTRRGQQWVAKGRDEMRLKLVS